MELNRRYEILYTPETTHVAFEAMVRNCIDLAVEGVRLMLRVARKGVRRESLGGYALLPRESGPPAWIPPNSYDMLSGKGFWRAKCAHRFDSELENGLVNNALKNGFLCFVRCRPDICSPSGTGDKDVSSVFLVY